MHVWARLTIAAKATTRRARKYGKVLIMATTKRDTYWGIGCRREMYRQRLVSSSMPRSRIIEKIMRRSSGIALTVHQDFLILPRLLYSHLTLMSRNCEPSIPRLLSVSSFSGVVRERSQVVRQQHCINDNEREMRHLLASRIKFSAATQATANAQWAVNRITLREWINCCNPARGEKAQLTLM